MEASIKFSAGADRRAASADSYSLHHAAGIIENKQSRQAAQNHEGLVLVGVEMTMWRDAEIGVYGIQRTMRGVVVGRVKVAVLAPARAGPGCSANLVKQRRVDRRAHA